MSSLSWFMAARGVGGYGVDGRLTRVVLALSGVLAAALVATAQARASGPVAAPTPPAPPNIVLILADDMGIDSVNAFNAKSGIATPNLDRLASQGMSFTDAHSGSAVCSPTRYGLLTGRYAWRTRLKSGIVDKWQGPLIAGDRLTVGGMLHDAGYHTACIGKWHLGWHWPDAAGATTTKPESIDFSRPLGGGPTTRGFDRYFGDDVPNWPPYAWIADDRLTAWPKGTMTADPGNGVSPGPAVEGWRLDAVLPTITARCADYIDERARTKQPFFLYFAMTTPHTPINPSPRFAGKSGVSPYADLLMETDWSVGVVLAALETAGVAKDTLVIFTADNGTSPKCRFDELEKHDVRLRESWRGHKADIWEGGHRVPFIARWPGRIAAGAVVEPPIGLVDVMATAADVVGCALPASAAEDSVSLLPLLRGEVEWAGRDRAIVHHSSRGFFAVRRGRWKAEFCGGSGGWSPPTPEQAREQGLPPAQLYDLDRDPKESENRATTQPDVLEALREVLRDYVERGRSTAGPRQPNDDGRDWWPRLPWPRSG